MVKINLQSLHMQAQTFFYFIWVILSYIWTCVFVWCLRYLIMSWFLVGSPTSIECWLSTPNTFSMSRSSWLVTTMWRHFPMFWSTSSLTQSNVFWWSLHLLRASMTIYAWDNPSRICCRISWSSLSDGCWTLHSLCSSANFMGIPLWSGTVNWWMSNWISFLWSFSSAWSSLPSKKKYAIPSDGVGLGSLSTIQELWRHF